uniref:HORMA domain-containing protein n=1 Tax=Anopheles farauti TaxID=69004 RepID=A0A182Q9N4_9DIPT
MTLGPSDRTTLKDSAKFVADFIQHSMNLAIFKRGVCTDKKFLPVDYNGGRVMALRSRKIKPYFSIAMGNLQRWLVQRKVSKVSLLFHSSEVSKETIERWDFNIEPLYENDQNCTSNKLLVKIRSEIHEVLREINALDEILPGIEQSGLFNVFIHLNGSAEFHDIIALNEYQAGYHDYLEVKNAETMDLKGISTGVHKVSVQIYYKANENVGPRRSQTGLFLVTFR